MKHRISLLLTILCIAIGIALWISGAYRWSKGIFVYLGFTITTFTYSDDYFVGLVLVLSGVIVVTIALRASAIVSSAIPKAIFGSGIGFLIFLALKSQFPLEALILGGLISGLIAWSGIRRGLYTGLVSGILCSVLDSFYYVSLFDIGILGIAAGIESALRTSIIITIVMAICGALGGLPSSPTAFYLIPGRGE